MASVPYRFFAETLSLVCHEPMLMANGLQRTRDPDLVDFSDLLW